MKGCGYVGSGGAGDAEQRLVELWGELTAQTYARAAKLLRAELHSGTKGFVFQLAYLESADDVGVSLLINFATEARAAYRKVVWRNMPDWLLTLASGAGLRCLQESDILQREGEEAA